MDISSDKKPLSDLKIPLAPLRMAIVEAMKEKDEIDLQSLLELIHRVYRQNLPIDKS